MTQPITLIELLNGLEEELDRVVAEDKADEPNLTSEDVAYNNGWAGGMRRALFILKRHTETQPE